MTATPRRRRLRWIAIPIAAVLLIAAAIGTELLIRSVVASTASDEIRAALPDGVSADISATPTGACVTCEVIGGELSGLDVVGHDVAFGELRGEVAAQASRVELGEVARIGRLEGAVTVGEAELKSILDAVAASQGIDASGLELTDGGVRYRSRIELFGQSIDVQVVAAMSERPGGRILISANELSVIGPGGATTALDLDPNALAFTFCVAEYLPQVLELTKIDITASELTVHLRSTGPFVADEATFQQLGTCPSA